MRPHAASCSCSATVAEWYRDYAAMLRRYLLARLRDPHTADECASETFLRAMANRHTFRCTGDGVRPWLFTIARNVAYDHEKRACRRYETPVELLVDRCDRTPTPEEATVRRALAAALHRRIAELPGDQGRCVRLRFLEGFSVAETARALDRNDGAIRALQHRAVRNLARSLAVPGHSQPRPRQAA